MREREREREREIRDIITLGRVELIKLRERKQKYNNIRDD